MFTQLRYLIELGQSHRIARRYFVTNGFDGVMTMLGILMGFRVSGSAPVDVMTVACLGAATALCISGLTSAYISESVEKKHELRQLEKSMLSPLDETAHGLAARTIPWLIAMVNGFAPLFLTLLVLIPLFLGHLEIWRIISPLDAALLIALVISFLLGVFLARLSGRFWLWAGIRTLVIALATSGIIILLHRLLVQL